jgi:TetR/AcrR family transcriptional repressor of nem operon
MRGTGAREKLVEAARDLMLGKGYPATTVDEICKEAGVTKGSFYHFFKTKEEIGLAALEDYQRRGREKLMNGPFAELDDPVEQAFGFLDHAEAHAQELWGRGCLLGNFATELASTNPVLQEEVSRIFRELTATLARIFEPVSQRDRSGKTTGTELAEHFLSVLEGGIVMARAHDDWRHIVRGIGSFRRHVQLLLR